MLRDKFGLRNMCFIIGTLFGIGIYYCLWFFIPSIVILIIGGIQSFEFSLKRKKVLEDNLDYKFRVYEEEMKIMKREIESLKIKINVTQMYGQK